MRWVEAPGNLAPAFDPGCVTMATADARLSPPDMVLGVQACGKAGNWDAAGELSILILLRADFDVRRVVEPTAHQAGQELLVQLYERQSEAERASQEAAIRGLPIQRPRSATSCVGRCRPRASRSAIRPG
jgi:hypothetical protein